ncbi:putative helicase [Acidithiobacillus ferrivorans]|uniref:Adenine specific DNA methyltransferase n=1 Tax=Acidithiobacillus ferrivorans TaxID=160808 RepID=A0A060UTL6_9PROT|nr:MULTISPECIES: type ISP restriction/modification enzyme [Acidithiobacillus]MBU2832926.1 DEAD/DEAH box helicase [Acidithiobacillus ferriphilus]MEB8476514.1 DEAD/DEAH box helicase family protein [Acidithiobacillus ferriphilus]CDQ11755.1 Adenine specific DNA methyltransferase [Acidithiobacillus ferrivorans]SMH66727.1 putative helicase [Acidithiobacillus ferrivorans]
MPVNTIHDILAQFRQYTVDQRGKGDAFERLMAAFLRLDPMFADQFAGVWLWKDWPGLQAHGFSAQDKGVDLVAEDRDGGFCAIQCKFYGEDQRISMDDLGTFFMLSGREPFTSRLIVSTTDHWGKNADEMLDTQQIRVRRIGLADLENSVVDWSAFDVEKPESLRRKTGKQIRPHQESAREDVLIGFQDHDRGKLIMACGTGKTYTSLSIMEYMVQPGGHVLFLVPSLALLAQTLREWTAEAHAPLRCYAVCSDSKVGKEEEDIRVHDLAYPATTDFQKLAMHLNHTSDDGRITVIFSTYQSIEVVHEAQKAGCPAFDLVICDEAHRTAGVAQFDNEKNTLEYSHFVRVHDNDYIHAQKRLYMTATPKIYKDDASRKAEEKGHLVYSMSNEAHFGPVFHRLSFAEAVDRDLLSDYKVLILAVDQESILQELEDRIGDSGDSLKLDDAVKIVGCWNGLAKRGALGSVDFGGDAQPMRTAVAFAGTIPHSKLLAREFMAVVDELREDEDGSMALEAEHVDGTMDVLTRNHKLDWLKANTGSGENTCRILTNVRCLSEGVDVPALDAVIFLNPRDSIVDVVQSVGRVMRKAPGKKYGYVILPIGIPGDKDPEKALDDNKKYRVVWQVLNALRAHDDRLEREFATIDLNKKKDDKINVIGVKAVTPPKKDRVDVDGVQSAFELTEENLSQWKDAIYAKVVEKCGDRRYWESWAKDVAEIAQNHRRRIEHLLKHPKPGTKEAFDTFLGGLRENINPNISRDEAVEMLSQHIVTRPVFDALFSGYAFTSHNPVSQAMQGMLDILEGQALEKDMENLKDFYDSVRQRASGLDNHEARQRVIVELYEKFFSTAFKSMTDRLGIVYTPVEIVDFIVNSANVALQKEFGVSLADKHVHILDPFTGTGTFLVRLIQNGLIPPDKLPYKYAHELHANEIVLLAYYIAAINIEAAYHDISGQDYQPFPGIVLTDTFMMGDQKGQSKTEMFSQENSERARRQNQADIRVILGNPPYSVGQDNANDNNQNFKYEALDANIRNTYAAHSTATNKNSLYDSYIRAFRWASNRIKDQGVICFVSNGGWIDGNTMDGFRKSLADEFTSVYVFNLRGNTRTSGETARKEGGQTFGSGSRATVAITLLVKNPVKAEGCEIHYRDIGDCLSREEKLAIISEAGSIKNVPWERIAPNDHNDWVNLRSDNFETFTPLNDDPGAIFSMRSRGVETSRDDWVYNYSKDRLETNVREMIAFYNAQVDLHGASCRAVGGNAEKKAQELIDTDSRKIKWTRGLVKELCRNNLSELDSRKIGVGVYRPFSKSWIYYDRVMNEYFKEKLYPTAHHQNLAISVANPGESNAFSCIMLDTIPNLHVIHGGQCFPLYHYEKAQAPSGQTNGLFDEPADAHVDADGYTRKNAITDTALTDYRAHYQDDEISKEDIFYYVYGILHSPEYRERYANDLKKMLPRIPFAQDFRGFSKAGRDLAYWHLNYEKVDPYEGLQIIIKDTDKNLPPHTLYHVDKIEFAKLGRRERDKSIIHYNGYITIKGIPLEAYEYVVNGKPAIEWIMERYKITVDKDSGIKNDPNDWCREHDDPAYIFRLVQQVVRVSVETVRIVDRLQELSAKVVDK